MEDEKLIEFVRRYEFLYNLKHPKYMDSARKETAWQEIADQLQQSAAACKERWQNLRDSYRRALSKKKGKRGQAARNTKPWKYENEMAFVVPFFVKRKLLEAVGTKSEDDDPDTGGDERQQAAGPWLRRREVHESAEMKVEGEQSDLCADDYSIETAHICNKDHSENSSMEKKRKVRKRKLVESENTASAMLVARLLADRGGPATRREHTELDRFFLNISDTVQKFSPYLQALAKNKIFNLVSEMELQQLAAVPTTSKTTQ